MLIILFCFVDATSGGTSGSGQVAEFKRDKIVILKGRGRIDSNVS
jgi:regulator of nonsense transcripts 3